MGEIDGVPTLHRCVPIIHNNTPIPVTNSEVFDTMLDHQKAVDVKIYQGEDPDAQHHVATGHTQASGIHGGLIETLADAMDAMDAGDNAAMKKSVEALSDILYYLES